MKHQNIPICLGLILVALLALSLACGQSQVTQTAPPSSAQEQPEEIQVVSPSPSPSAPDPGERSMNIPITTSAAPGVAPDITVHAVGEVIRMQGLAMLVLGWEPIDVVHEPPLPPPIHPRYRMVDMVFKNESTENINLRSHEIKMRHSEGATYEIYRETIAGFFMNYKGVREGPGFDAPNTLRPGDVIREQVIFGQTLNDEGYTLVYKMGNYEDELILVDLGDAPVSVAQPAEMLDTLTRYGEAGQVVTSDGLSMALLSWEFLPCSTFHEDEQCVKLEVAVANQGDQIVEVMQEELKDMQGQVYQENYSRELLRSQGEMGKRSLLPGERSRYEFVFWVSRPDPDMVFSLSGVLPKINPYDRPNLPIALGPQPGRFSLPAGFPGEAAPGAAPCGQIVQAGDLRISVTGQASKQTSEYGNPKEGNHFLIVDLQLENTGQTFIRSLTSIGQLQIKDSQARIYGTNAGMSSIPLTISEIEAGQKVNGQIVFDVPVDEESLYLKVGYRTDEGQWYSGITELTAGCTGSPGSTGAAGSQTLALGEVIEHGSMKLAILGWSMPAQFGYAQAAPGEKLVLVEVFIANPTDETQRIFGFEQFKLRDAAGNQYDYDRSAYIPVSSDPLVRGFLPGQRVRADLVFHVKDDSQDFLLRVDSAPMQGNFISIPLGATSLMVEQPPTLPVWPTILTPPGTTVEEDGIRLLVTAVDYPGTVLGGRTPLNGKKFITVSFEVSNTTDKSVEMYPTSLCFLQDDQGYLYQSNFPVQSEPDMLTSLDPGATAKATVIFEVDANIAGFVFFFITPNRHIEDPPRQHILYFSLE